MGKAIQNSEGFVKLCDYMDACAKEIGNECLQLKRFEDNNAIIRVLGIEISLSLDDIDNWSYNTFKFNLAEVYCATANKESEH